MVFFSHNFIWPLGPSPFHNTLKTLFSSSHLDVGAHSPASFHLYSVYLPLPTPLFPHSIFTLSFIPLSCLSPKMFLTWPHCLICCCPSCSSVTLF